jgi:hypothetical protein
MIADELGVSLQTVKNYSSNLRNFGDILPPKVRPTGCRPLLKKEMGDVCVLSLLQMLLALMIY